MNEEIPEFIQELSRKVGFTRVSCESYFEQYLTMVQGVLHTITYKSERQYVGGSTLSQAFGKHIVPGDSEETMRNKSKSTSFMAS